MVPGAGGAESRVDGNTSDAATRQTMFRLAFILFRQILEILFNLSAVLFGIFVVLGLSQRSAIARREGEELAGAGLVTTLAGILNIRSRADAVAGATMRVLFVGLA